MTTDTLTTADRIAMLLGGGLVLLGTMILGFVNVISNAPHMPVVEEGTVVATPVVSPDLRAYVIALGLLVWLGFAIYKLTRAPSVEVEQQTTPAAD
ncbi:hypothetical protein ACFO5R_09025 [Halosolutus amylolyticus]|uniref:Cox cluster protein n=1 Tax=Halosolutus amylolyticus TaxID=2932267 RepID=A0ABD5PNK9_9EURY|nr:hypothetical protein [Halosolutus amylolyticus]